MTERGVTESVVEQVALAWLESAEWTIVHGPDACDSTNELWRSLTETVIMGQMSKDPTLPSARSSSTKPPIASCGQRMRSDF